MVADGRGTVRRERAVTKIIPFSPHNSDEVLDVLGLNVKAPAQPGRSGGAPGRDPHLP
ncbi:hypothetical protein GCM10010185_29110 [Saccharothrix coeruleofusca]|uniref:Uncharacterized protein n=1 Tax=Saccharothrix coeruleofusca TaxID=33919 RepID=A0A918ALL8_9PSEU|nr:hypothetical protein GCM10010185_29110 [Saccharothrix coeruleofusca]